LKEGLYVHHGLDRCDCSCRSLLRRRWPLPSQVVAQWPVVTPCDGTPANGGRTTDR
jgi:hypothetical protein